MRIEPPPLDYDYAITRISQFLKDMLTKTDAKGFVMGLSGGVDSSVTLTLAIHALGKDKIKVLIMPDRETTPPEDVDDAISLAESLGVEYTVIDIADIIDAYAKYVPFFDKEHKIATGNLRARIRMSILYYYANKHGLLVMGTGDKSEILLGYFTKYGDGGVDVLPLGDIYKTQVRELGRRLGVPEKILTKPSSPRLWPGQLAEEELGVKYEVIDAILYRYVDLRMNIDDIANELGIDRDIVVSIVKRVHVNEHKRLFPLIPRISTMAITHDWKMPWYSRPVP